ncbi:hypothetical protein ADU59_00195 (plasmid) [Pararhizobium polonicum]|uniref:Uncharacterized protein n=1 Tax=Pararhizobium polonicum TaxID=1612624 RepID=A0A1C7PCM1_9HYPH|nr:hypothetical protein ADU59_00195 [Pararhizobium polonicum]
MRQAARKRPLRADKMQALRLREPPGLMSMHGRNSAASRQKPLLQPEPASPLPAELSLSATSLRRLPLTDRARPAPLLGTLASSHRAVLLYIFFIVKRMVAV